MSFRSGHNPEMGREIPVGSELLIAFSIGIVSWWAILKMILWIAS